MNSWSTYCVWLLHRNDAESCKGGIWVCVKHITLYMQIHTSMSKLLIYIYYFLIYLIIKVCWFIQNDIWYTILQVCILCRLLLKWRVNVNEISARTRISLRDTLPTSINMPLRCCVFTIRNLTALQITSLCTAIRLLARANTLTTYAVNLVEERRCICKINK